MFALLWLGSPASAQLVATSARPDSVAVTIYRAPQRSADEAMNLQWLNGYALITEQRQISIPSGEADIRFEGVAGGIVPESAIVTGLPDGVVEKNQDAYLLSPASLLDRSLGRRVHIRRTSRATGAVREYEAVIRSGAQGGVVLQTQDGIEALRCSGLPETIVYPSVPEGLSAKPTLSVRTRSSRAATATVTLSYLATGFDWQANYVARLAPSEERMDLFAWVTLANGDETSFVDAAAQTVAGRLNKEDNDRRQPPQGEPLRLRCWPSDTTSDIPLYEPPPPPPPPPSPPPPAAYDEIVVTGARMRQSNFASPSAVTVIQEELGDLKLYVVPIPVTVAAHSQKQVALLERESVKVRSVYRQRIRGEHADWRPTTQVIVTRNRKAEGLGVPLPAGGVVLFSKAHDRPILIGEGSVEDRAVDEDVEIEIAEATGVQTRLIEENSDGGRTAYLLTVSNDRDRPVQFEAELQTDGANLTSKTRLSRRDGRPLWAVTVPANGRKTLRFSVKDPDSDD